MRSEFKKPANIQFRQKCIHLKGCNLSEENIALEGASCNLSTGNSGYAKDGMSCVERVAVELHMEDKFSIIKILAGQNKNGPVYEELPATQLDDGAYRLLASPGLVLGFAKNDLLSLDEEGKARLLKHGGNFCIQIYLENPDEVKISRVAELVSNKLAGTIDGTGGGTIAFSIPITNGFEKTNATFDQISAILGVEYYYSNVYKNPGNPNDETLTDWAEQLEN